jgi:DNA modification methylase
MASNGNGWRNRIVGHGEKPADQFQAHPRNWRQHPKAQREALAAALNGVGWVDTVIENVQTGHLIDGHERIWQALDRGDNTPVPFTQVDLSDDEEQLILATFDSITGMAIPDQTMLEDLLADLRVSELVVERPDLDALLHEVAARANVAYGAFRNAGDDPGADMDRAEELREQWQTERGQVWEIPSATVQGRCHRVMCGDSTSETDVVRLMDGEKADAVVTDPPYGVDYEGGRNPVSNVPRAKIDGDLTANLYRPFLNTWKKFITAKCVFYLWFADREGLKVYSAVFEEGLEVRALIIWNKLDAHYGNFMAQYMQKHEPCLYCVQGSTNWYGPTNEVTVWDIKQPTINANHPTEKPVKCMQRPITNSTKSGNIVVDGFLGSGTTAVAAEQTGRICYGMELEPKYIAVTLERLAGMGLEPRLTSEMSE